MNNEVERIVQQTEALLRLRHEETLQETTPQRLHECLGEVVMMQINDSWVKTKKRQTAGRRAFYFSAEYLVGRLVYSNLFNLGILDEVKKAFQEKGVDLACLEEIEDAALGSRFYGLIKSTDGGAHWQVVSSDPFGGQMGGSVEFTFLDEMFGFATLSHNGGDAAVLYVTEDGGKHYEQVEFAHKTYTDSIGNIVAPYDYPKMPYEKDGVIYVLCGQGADGDYDGGDSLHLARYRSEDYGHSFVFDTLVDGTSEG